MNNSILISSIFRKEVLEMVAYKVANAQGFIKLDAMENPFSWPEEIKKEWIEHLKEAKIINSNENRRSELNTSEEL